MYEIAGLRMTARTQQGAGADDVEAAGDVIKAT